LSRGGHHAAPRLRPADRLAAGPHGAGSGWNERQSVCRRSLCGARRVDHPGPATAPPLRPSRP
ncbi:MAG: hypothetical protein ACOVME_05900, partial [Rhodobacter sp.]